MALAPNIVHKYQFSSHLCKRKVAENFIISFLPLHMRMESIQPLSTVIASVSVCYYRAEITVGSGLPQGSNFNIILQHVEMSCLLGRKLVQD